MQVKRVLATCLVGALGVMTVPQGAPAAATATIAAPQSWHFRTASSVQRVAHLAPSLVQLRAEVDARWPRRSRASDGWLGDWRHQLSRSDHNPVGHPMGPQFGSFGSVHAIDITAYGIDTSEVLRAVIGDSRVWYVIHNGYIWSRTYGWVPQQYRGDPHRGHIHISIRGDSQSAALAAERDTRRWLSGIHGASLSSSLSAPQVQALQRALIARGYPIPSGPTGFYGPQTRAAVAAFQRAQGWTGSSADGIAGPRTLALLGVNGGAHVSVTQVSTGSPAHSGTYSPGVSGPHVAALQRALIARGFAIPAGVTGLFGSQTQAAVAAFQRAQGWSGSSADGIPGPGTLARLGLAGGGQAANAAPAHTPASGYSVGARGPHVAALQRALIARGFAIPAGVTGLFGSQTQAAVAAFQRAQGWSGSSADGIPGPGTLARLGLR